MIDHAPNESGTSETAEVVDLASQTLAAVRDSKVSADVSQPRRPSGRSTQQGKQTRAGWGDRRSPTEGARPDERDPRLIGESIDKLVTDLGWSTQTAVAGVIGRWVEVAGQELASHVVPESFDAQAGTLLLRADATAWATQTRFLIPTLQRRLDDEVGPGIVRQIDVFGPTAPVRSAGRLRVPGRGPRDTYG